MYRKIKPDNGYCLYFPNRKQGARFEAGRRVRVCLWEEWKHIKLGQFEVKIPADNAEKEIVTSAEDLCCGIEAKFQIVVGGKEEGREARLKKATISCAPTKDIRDKIELAFFRDWATNYCRTSIIKAVKECNYVSLIEDVDYRANAAKRIEDDARKTLEDIGLILIRGEVFIEPLEPDSVLTTTEILTKWLEYQKILNDSKIKKQKVVNEHQELIAGLENEHSKRMKEIEQEKIREANDIEQKSKIHRLELANEMKKRESEIDIKEKAQIRDKEEKIKAIQEQLNAWAQETQLKNLGREAELKEEEEKKNEEIAALKGQHEQYQLLREAELKEGGEKKNEELAKLQREFECRKLQHELEKQKNELEMIEIRKKAKKTEAETEAELVELKDKIVLQEIEHESKRGIARADIIRAEVLAKSANEIKMKKLLMEAMPEVMRPIMEMANRPIEKMGEVKLNIYGGPDTILGQNNILNTIISSTSTLPAIKEWFRFIKDYAGEIFGLKSAVDTEDHFSPFKDKDKKSSTSDQVINQINGHKKEPLPPNVAQVSTASERNGGGLQIDQQEKTYASNKASQKHD